MSVAAEEPLKAVEKSMKLEKSSAGQQLDNSELVPGCSLTFHYRRTSIMRSSPSRVLFLFCMNIYWLRLILPYSGSTDSWAQPSNEKAHGKVELNSEAVEVVETKPVAEACPNQKQGTTIRLRVRGDTAVDVRVFSQINAKTWAGKDFPNKRGGDEITTYLCDSHARFKVYTRAARSNEPWPRP